LKDIDLTQFAVVMEIGVMKVRNRKDKEEGRKDIVSVKF
jgi:hypothetical protein